MLLNCGVGEDSWESLGLQGDQPVNLKVNQSCIFIGRTDAEAETPILWPPDARNWLMEKTLRLGKIEGEGDDRGWDGWMASLTQWTWVWANSGSWWWTGRPGMLQSLGLQRVRHDWINELNWTWGEKKLELYKVTNQYNHICHLALSWKFSKSEKISQIPFEKYLTNNSEYLS